ncbi:xanthine dehydrogenase family protein molybdopterin-binding subunit [Chloroflexota bacterium]
MDYKDTSIVGKNILLREGYPRVTGMEKFVTDRSLIGALWMKILRSPHPHARIIDIDATKAEARHGAGAVLTYKDVPPNDVGCGIFNWKGKVLEDRARYIGDEVAAVAAVSEKSAEEALDAIRVEYEMLPAVFDIEEAMKPGAPDVRGTGTNLVLSPPEPGFFPSNQRWGDVEKGFAEADAAIECEIKTQSVYGGFFPPACIAEWYGDKITILLSHQSPFQQRTSLSCALGIPENKVRIIVPLLAGTFGTLNSAHRFWLIAALLSKKAGRPVIYKMTPEEYGIYKRREYDILRVKMGGKKDGSITALDYVQYFDNGGYGYKSTTYGTIHDIFPRANVRHSTYGISTNKFSSGCIRAVGDVPQAFAINQAVDMLAEKLGVDPLTIWKKNHHRAGDPRRCLPIPGLTLSSEAYDELIDKGAEAIDWEKKWRGWGKPYHISGAMRRGVGISVALHASGVSRLAASAIIKVNHDGSAQVEIGFTEMGTGSKTTLAQVCAEAMGFKIEDVYVVKDIDTDNTPHAPVTSASSGLHVGGAAVKVAALDAKQQILEMAATASWRPDSLKGIEKPDELDINDSIIFVKKEPDRCAPVSTIVGLITAPMVIGRALTHDLPSPGRMAYIALASFADVEVDTETGQVNVLKLVSCHDAGRIVNQEVCENQVLGGIVQSLGYALSEEISFDPGTGKELNPALSLYCIPTSMDVPAMDAIFSENIDPVGPFGAKGIGEAPAVCPHSAVASAIYNATGVKMHRLPITPDKLLAALTGIESSTELKEMTQIEACRNRITEREYCYCKICKVMRYSSELEATEQGIKCSICGSYDLEAPGWVDCPYEKMPVMKCPRAGIGITSRKYGTVCTHHCHFRKTDN